MLTLIHHEDLWNSWRGCWMLTLMHHEHPLKRLCTVSLARLKETMFGVFDWVLLKVTLEGGPSGPTTQPMHPSNPMTAR